MAGAGSGSFAGIGAGGPGTGVGTGICADAPRARTSAANATRIQRARFIDVPPIDRARLGGSLLLDPAVIRDTLPKLGGCRLCPEETCGRGVSPASHGVDSGGTGPGSWIQRSEVRVPIVTALKRILVLGEDAPSILPLVREAGFSVVTDAPDVVLTYGGDGLLLHSEREWPGVPKLALRNSRFGKKCEPRTVEDALNRLARGELRALRQSKVRAEAAGQTRVGLNDIIVHNARPMFSVRFRVWIDGESFGDEIVGDGLVVATTFGSTAYYRSITRSIFRVGLGLAFNNSTQSVDHLVVAEDAKIRLRIERGPAIAAADNDPDAIPLETGDEVEIRRDDAHAIILQLGARG
jgi:NAD+ kinase